MGGGSRTISRTNYSKVASEHKTFDQNASTNSELPKKRVFISFHMENEAQIQLLRHQAKSDKFDLEFTDYSVKEPFDSHWKMRCSERIRQSSVVICMIGTETYKRPAVLWELNTAYQMGKTVIGVRIHKDRNDPIPGPLLRNRAKIITWNMEDMQNAIDEE